MDGDIEGQPYRFIDAPDTRGLELRGRGGRAYEDGEFQDIVDAFDKLKSNEPETVLATSVRLDEARGRLAVGMTVHGTHTELHYRANEWLRLLGNDGSQLGYEWSIGH